MDLRFSEADEAFRADVRAFLRDNLTEELRAAGRAAASAFSEKEWNIGWLKVLNARGWAAPHWPVEYGGTGWSVTQRYIFDTECALAQTPNLSPMGLKMVSPVIMAFGRPDQKAFYLPRILAGEDYWCQGYSEPGSGSDLASLKCRAVSDGDDYIIDGTKIWTTQAHFANRMFALVRTDTSGKPQEGITFILIDMDTPGITIQPIITLAGDHEVNQVFFDGVRVPKANRIGAEGEGWTIAKYLLVHERSSSYGAGIRVSLKRVREVAGATGALDDHAFRMRLAEAGVALEALTVTEHRVMAAISQGAMMAAESSMLKTQGTELMQRVNELGLEALQYAVMPYEHRWISPGANDAPLGPQEAPVMIAQYLNNRAMSIYAGANEVQRNIMSKLVLGL
ncbi:acyl-CoA dehydrogenase family protein [Zavarzinia aquatilis]|uniref:Acyl-CoA dehydrogenase n=1 Tax=Zavarzinia aquatilis TaxID=2211142 RepID=A0A317E1Y4_9PROT|nr:acyl-CoA dehydrogenase family protein [Zavarzinia aquatilis]PWR20136.1 acyl-CoA dehydrogenase [Zavarzinia aquatilis]